MLGSEIQDLLLFTFKYLAAEKQQLPLVKLYGIVTVASHDIITLFMALFHLIKHQNKVECSSLSLPP
jgi:hypothetical protein